MNDHESTTLSKKTAWLFGISYPMLFLAVLIIAYGGLTPKVLNALSGLIVVSTLLIAAFTDAIWNKIYNWTTYPPLLWGLVILVATNVIPPGSARSAWFDDYIEFFLSPPTAFHGLLGMFVCFFTLLGIHSFSGCGAGDVKIAAVIGLFLGMQRGILAIAYTYVFAGFLSIVWILLRHGFHLGLAEILIEAMGWRKQSTSHSNEPEMDSEEELRAEKDPAATTGPRRISLGPYFALGTLTVIFEIDKWFEEQVFGIY